MNIFQICIITIIVIAIRTIPIKWSCFMCFKCDATIILFLFNELNTTYIPYLWMHYDVVRKRDKVDSLSGFTNIYWNLNGWRSDSLIETMAAWPSVAFALERSALCFVIHWEFKIRSRVIQMIQVMSDFIITERDSLYWLLFFVGIFHELKW